MAAEKSALERLLRAATCQKSCLGSVEDPARKALPTLFHWLTNTDAGPKHEKEPARLSIRATAGGFTVTLTDESLAVSLDAASTNLGDLLGALEAALTASSPAIRPWGRKGVKLKLKPKKREDEN